MFQKINIQEKNHLNIREFSPIPIYINMDLDQNPNNLDKISIYRLDKGLFNAPCYCGDRNLRTKFLIRE